MSAIINPFLVGGGGWSDLSVIKLIIHNSDLGYSAGYIYSDAFNTAIPISSLSFSATQNNANTSARAWAFKIEGLNENSTWDELYSESATINGSSSKTLSGTATVSSGKYSQFRMYSIDGARFSRADSYVEITK